MHKALVAINKKSITQVILNDVKNYSIKFSEMKKTYSFYPILLLSILISCHSTESNQLDEKVIKIGKSSSAFNLSNEMNDIDFFKLIYLAPADWQKINNSPLTREDEEIITQTIKFGCQIEGIDSSLVSNFKKIDLNSDGLEDLIFRQNCPYSEFYIYLLTSNKHYIEVAHYPGELMSIDKDSIGSKMIIRSEACCCERNNSLREISILRGKFEVKKTKFLKWDLDFMLINRIFIEQSTYFPEKATKEKFILRSTISNEDSIFINQCVDNEILDKNKIGTIKSNSKYVSLISIPDTKDFEWELILVNLPNENFIPNLKSVQLIGNEDSMVIGWIRKKPENSD